MPDFVAVVIALGVLCLAVFLIIKYKEKSLLVELIAYCLAIIGICLVIIGFGYSFVQEFNTGNFAVQGTVIGFCFQFIAWLLHKYFGLKVGEGAFTFPEGMSFYVVGWLIGLFILPWF